MEQQTQYLKRIYKGINMYKYIKDGVVFTQNEINRMKIDNPISLGFKVVQDIIPEHDSYRV